MQVQSPSSWTNSQIYKTLKTIPAGKQQKGEKAFPVSSEKTVRIEPSQPLLAPTKQARTPDKALPVSASGKAKLAENDQARQQQKTSFVQKKEVVEVTPVLVEPLNVRERNEVREAIQKGALDDNRRATQLFKQFDRQLQSVPHTINRQKLSDPDKLKLLVGDYSDHQNTKFTVQKDRTVKMEGTVNDLLTNRNSQFSEQQLDLKNQQSKVNNLGLSH